MIMEKVTDKDKNIKDPNIIKTISIILSEIINENKAELKGKETTGKAILNKINIKPFLIQKSHPQYQYNNT
jgi:hypothetical protein